ncbi:zinc finger CCCH domain-containing protein 18-like [Montipora capricornis]|uniref:zinc finger CCCH domain-containing protein 18-like n=1 Tax=Montipora capricornis TaxID=246305 RepID=UPI0035F1126A
MLPIPGQYPSPFPKPPVIPPVPAEAIVQGPVMTSYQDHEEQVDEIVPELPAAAKKETAWERGLKLAKEIKKAAQKRKEEDADFEEKRMVLGITAEDNDDENDKENLTRRREMLRNRVEKELIVDEDDARYRRGGDIVSRWRDKRPTSPMHYKDRDRRKRRGNRSPSSSPERDRRNRRRTGDSEKVKTRTKDTTRERDKERSKKTAAAKDTATDGKPGERLKSKRNRMLLKKTKQLGKQQEQEQQQQQQQQQQRQETNLEQRKTEPDDRRKIKVPEKGESADVKPTKETDKKVELIGGGAEEKDKLKTKVLGISSSRLPNDEWIDPWQRTTSPKRHSVSSASSRSRSSSSSSDSSRSSRSRSHSGSESRSTSHSASRSRSRSASHTPSRSPSRSHSRSRSKTRSRSGSVSSASEHSSSSSSKSATVEVKPGVGWEEKNEKQASHDSSDSESGSESESNPSISKSKSKSKSPDSVPKSPVKPKPTPDKGPRTPPKESTLTRNVKDVKDRKNRFEYGRRERIEKGRPMRQGASWNRRLEGSRLTDDHNRDRDYHSRTRKNLDRRRRSRSPARARNGDRRRLDEGRTRERSSSADSMEHALARPSSPRPTRERGGLRRGSGVSSSDTESASSDSESESEEEEEEDRNLVRTRRAGPETDQVKRNIPLSSGNIRYTGHKDIKLTLNKSVSRPDREETKPPSHHPPQERTEASSSSEKQVVAKKRTRDSSPVLEASNLARDVVSSSVPAQTPNKNDKRSADSQVDTATSGKANTANTSSRREELLRELKAVEDAIARKRARIE